MLYSKTDPSAACGECSSSRDRHQTANRKIWISGNVSEGKLILIVKDNGRGMTKEQIRDLFNSHAKKTNGLSAVGIPNVKERLELYYGTQGGMEYVSSGNGTEVTVFLPAIYDMPEEGRKN